MGKFPFSKTVTALARLPKHDLYVGGLLWLVLFCISTGFKIVEATAKSLFVERLGALQLPPAYIVEAVLWALAGLSYLVWARKYHSDSLFILLLLLWGLCGPIAAALQTSGSTASTTAMFVLQAVMFRLIVLHWGIYVIEFFTPKHRVSALPFIYSANLAASVASGTYLTVDVHTTTLCLFVGVGISTASVVPVWLLRKIERHSVSKKEQMNILEHQQLKKAVLRDMKYLFRSGPALYMLLATVALVVARKYLSFMSNVVIQKEYGTAQAMTHTWGTLLLIGGATTFVLQFFAGGKLIDRIGPTTANLLYSFVILLSFPVLGLSPVLFGLITARLAEYEVKNVLKTPFTIMMYGAMPPAVRKGIRGAIYGVIVPMSGIFLGSLLSVIFPDTSAPSRFVLVGVGMFTGLMLVVGCVGQNTGYVIALTQSLEFLLTQYEIKQNSAGVSGLYDARILETSRVRRTPLRWIFGRRRLALKLCPFFIQSDPTNLDRDKLEIALDELLLLVELFRPFGSKEIRKSLASALKSKKIELYDTARELIRSTLPLKYASKACNLLDTAAVKL